MLNSSYTQNDETMKKLFYFIILFPFLGSLSYTQIQPSQGSPMGGSLLTQFQSEPCGYERQWEIIKKANPGVTQLQTQEDLNIQNQLSLRRSTNYPIRFLPVVVHVISNRSSATNVCAEDIKAYIAGVNSYLQSDTTPGTIPTPFKSLVTDSKIRFKLAVRDSHGDPMLGITRTFSSTWQFTAHSDIVSTVPLWDPSKYINVYIANIDAYGWVPRASPKAIVIDYTRVTDPNGLTTFAHEIGHFFNLRHIWGKGGRGDSHDCLDEDYVDDTPLQVGPNDTNATYPQNPCSCVAPGLTPPCHNPHGDNFHNYMDYTDGLRTMFTAKQVDRMQADLTGNKSGLYVNNDKLDPVAAPAAVSSVSVGVVGQNLQISWVDNSTNESAFQIEYKEGCGTNPWRRIDSCELDPILGSDGKGSPKSYQFYPPSTQYLLYLSGKSVA